LQEIESGEGLKPGMGSGKGGSETSDVTIGTVKAMELSPGPPIPPPKNDVKERWARLGDMLDTQAMASSFTSGFSSATRYMLHGNGDRDGNELSRP
jgi:hypothetical protein